MSNVQLPVFVTGPLAKAEIGRVLKPRREQCAPGLGRSASFFLMGLLSPCVASPGKSLG